MYSPLLTYFRSRANGKLGESIKLKKRVNHVARQEEKEIHYSYNVMMRRNDVSLKQYYIYIDIENASRTNAIEMLVSDS